MEELTISKFLYSIQKWM